MNSERYVQTLDLHDKEAKTKLTKKQNLVYSYLMSISNWNPKENHYYAYYVDKNKSGRNIKKTCEYLGVTQPTWRSSLLALYEEGYIYYDLSSEEAKEERKLRDDVIEQIDGAAARLKVFRKEIIKKHKYCLIKIPNMFAPLDIDLIVYLTKVSISISKGGMEMGNLLMVYSVLYYYWNARVKRKEKAYLSTGQLAALFEVRRSADISEKYQMVIAYLKEVGLIDYNWTIETFNCQTYKQYEITKVNTKLVNTITTSDGPNNIDEIMQLAIRVVKEEVPFSELREEF